VIVGMAFMTACWHGIMTAVRVTVQHILRALGWWRFPCGSCCSWKQTQWFKECWKTPDGFQLLEVEPGVDIVLGHLHVSAFSDFSYSIQACMNKHGRI